jgi:3-oxoadipate enol-lactonase
VPFLDLPTHRLHYRIDGARGPWLVLCNSLGADLTMWDAQMPAFARDLRVLRYDRRGHGASTTPSPPFAIADLGADVLALLDALGIQRANFCGLSIGGLIGQWLGIHAPARIERLVVCATAAKIGTAETWRQRIAQVASSGLAPLVAGTRERWFSPAFVAAHPDLVGAALAPFTAVDLAAYIGCCDALATTDLRGDLARITAPLLAVSGHDDAVCPPAALQEIADAVSDGRHVSLPGRHLVNIESAAAFTERVHAFLVP